MTAPQGHMRPPAAALEFFRWVDSRPSARLGAVGHQTLRRVPRCPRKSGGGFPSTGFLSPGFLYMGHPLADRILPRGPFHHRATNRFDQVRAGSRSVFQVNGCFRLLADSTEYAQQHPIAHGARALSKASAISIRLNGTVRLTETPRDQSKGLLTNMSPRSTVGGEGICRCPRPLRDGHA